MSYFALLDCNNFYASCERLFHPGLERLPIVVLSNNDGCVVARSQEAKQLNIAMGVPYFEIKDLCAFHKVHVFSSNYRLYGNLSQRVMDILMETGLEVEIYSIDEAFLQFPDSISLEAAQTLCAEIRKKIKKWVGIPTAIGIAPTKTLAKLANYHAKRSPHGLFNLCHSEHRCQVLEDFPIEEVWGIGRNNKKKLNRIGVFTAKQFCDQDPLLIKRLMGVVGERMHLELCGFSCLKMEDWAPKQSITCSRSFGKRVADREELAEALSTFVNTACIKLREQESFARGMYVFLESIVDSATGRRRCYSQSITLPNASQDTGFMITHAKACLSRLYCEKEIYKKCGVVLLDLVQKEELVGDFFQKLPDKKSSKVMDTLDAINARFRKKAIFFAAMGTKEGWKGHSDKCSPNYTGCWAELAVAQA